MITAAVLGCALIIAATAKEPLNISAPMIIPDIRYTIPILFFIHIASKLIYLMIIIFYCLDAVFTTRRHNA
jgi:membrane-bound metal-dependent hydrolase YbcI (DUF457 family)